MGLFVKLFVWGPSINLFVEGYLQFFGWVHSSKTIGRGPCIKIFGVIYRKSLSWRMPIGITRGVMLGLDVTLFILKEKNWRPIPPESYNMF